MLKEKGFYRYPKCKDFSPQPTDHAICHTFNGLGIKNILKETKWTDAFTSSFKGAENNFVRKANGIELEHGFTFSIGNNDYQRRYYFKMKTTFLILFRFDAGKYYKIV